MFLLLVLFIVVPALELGILIEVGRWIGTLPTLGLIAVTGIVGAYLARRQGLGVLAQIRSDMAAGKIPAGALADGVMILIAGAVLMTPGILTDALGFSLLVPPVRQAFKRAFLRRLERSVRAGRSQVTLRFREDASFRGGDSFSADDPFAGDRQR